MMSTSTPFSSCNEQFRKTHTQCHSLWTQCCSISPVFFQVLRSHECPFLSRFSRGRHRRHHHHHHHHHLLGRQVALLGTTFPIRLAAIGLLVLGNSTETQHESEFHSGLHHKLTRLTLPETNIAPENGWLEYVGILRSFWGPAYFQGLC